MLRRSFRFAAATLITILLGSLTQTIGLLDDGNGPLIATVLVVLVVACALDYWWEARARRSIRQEMAQGARATLRISFGSENESIEPPYRIHTVNVVNDGPADARNVRLSVGHIDPEQPPIYRASLPIRFPAIELLRPNQVVKVRIARSWVNGTRQVHVTWLDGRQDDVTATKAPIAGPWTLRLDVVADNGEHSCAFILDPAPNGAALRRHVITRGGGSRVSIDHTRSDTPAASLRV